MIHNNNLATKGAMYCGVILSSDKTTVSITTGNVEYHLLYLSIGNIHNVAWHGCHNGCYKNWWNNMPHYHQSLKNCPTPHTQTYKFLCTLNTTKYMQYTPPECFTTQTNDSIDNWDTYIQLRNAYIHFIQPDQHYTIISLDTQWYHTVHLPISISAMTHTIINWNSHTSIMQTLQLPIKHRPFICYPLTP